MPEERQSRVVMGKIHSPQWVRDDFERRLSDLVSSGDEYIQETGKGKDKFVWVIGDQLVESIDEEKIIFARLGKIKSGLEETIYDKELKSFKRIKVDTPRALSYSNFIIHPESHIVLFEEKLPDISIKQFKEKISILYKRHFNDLSDVKIDLIVETERVFKILRRYDKITEVQFKVTPSNPEDEIEFRRLDHLLKDGSTKEANFRFKNEEDGLKIENTIIGEGISLSGAGYGEYNISVEKEEKREIIKSNDQILRKIVRVNDKPAELMRCFWEEIKEYLQQRKRP